MSDPEPFIPSDEQIEALAWDYRNEQNGYIKHSRGIAAWFVTTPSFQAMIRSAQAQAVRHAAEHGGEGFDLAPTISTLNGQNAFYWYDYLKQHNKYWKSRLSSLARKYENVD